MPIRPFPDRQTLSMRRPIERRGFNGLLREGPFTALSFAPWPRRRRAARSAADEWYCKALADKNAADVLSINQKGAAEAPMVALLRTLSAWRTRARDLRQPATAVGDKFPKSCRRPLALLAFVLALGRELFWRIEAD